MPNVLSQLGNFFNKHYPLLLFAIYTVDYWWSLIWKMEPVAWSLIIIFTFCLLIHLLVLRLIKEPNGVIISFIIIWIFLHLQFIQYTVQDISNFVGYKFRYPAALLLLLFIALMYHLQITQKSYHRISKGIFVCLISFFIVSATARTLDFLSFTEQYLTTTEEKHLKNIKINKRNIDIYYLVFDSYTSSGSLKEYFNYDNSALENYLQSKDFIITKKAKSKYDSTPFCLSSVFGMDTLSNNKKWPSLKEEAPIRSAVLSVGKSALFTILKNAKIDNYTYSIFPIETSQNKKIIWGLGQWSKINHLFQGTALKYIYLNFFINHLSNDKKIEEFFNKNIYGVNKSSFYFYHFHEPHFITAPGEFSYENTYIKKIKSTNERIVRVVDRIFEENTRPFIVVIQGDHGSREIMAENHNHPERFTIFNAIYFPDQNYSRIKDDFNPINTFRLILSQYYGAKLPLHEY